ncbi:MAG: ERCC4 domain-containing protein [Proteobacteria bacterium]|nr:ERCC4 domain-containing protein [Pseudomonadota bacterium]
MKIVIDSREQRPLDFSRWEIETVRGCLPTGDYSVFGYENRIALERKSINDLVGSVIHQRDRFEAELARGRELEVFAVVCECSMRDVARHHYTSRACPESVLQSLFAFMVRYGTPVIWADSPEGASYVVKSLLSKYLRERHKRQDALLSGSGDVGMQMRTNEALEPFSADMV